MRRSQSITLAVIAAIAVVAGVPVASADSPLYDSKTAVVDRFEGNQSVLVFDEGDVRTVGRSTLPADARHVDAVVQVTLVNDDIVSMRYDSEETRERQTRAQSRFDRLSREPPATFELFEPFGITCGYAHAVS